MNAPAQTPRTVRGIPEPLALAIMKASAGPLDTLAHWCDQLAFYSESLFEPIPRRSELPTSTIGFYMPDGGRCEIVVRHTGGTDHVWDQCTVDGVHCGNRCGARKALATRFARGLAMLIAKGDIKLGEP